MKLSIEKLVITRIRDGYVFGQTANGKGPERAVKFKREDWPVSVGDTIEIEYDLERTGEGDKTELIDVAYLRRIEGKQEAPPK